MPAVPDLASYVAYGLENNARLAAEFERWAASVQRIDQATALADPRFSYTEFLEQVQTRTGPQQRRFGVSQGFPWPGKLATQGRVAEREAEARWFQVEVEQRRVVSQIEVAYYDYAFFGQELRIRRELLELLQRLEPLVQARIRAGAGQEDLLRLQVEIGRLEDDLASLERKRPALSTRLADALNLREGARDLPVPEMQLPVPGELDLEGLREVALRQNPRLLSLAKQLEARREGESLAGYQRRPNFSVGVDYIDTGGALDGSVRGSGDDPVLFGFSISLPIWTASYSAAEREAQHRLRASQQEALATESEIGAWIEEQAYRVDDAARRIALYRDSLLPRTKQALELTLAAYRTGTVSSLDLIDSERVALELELSLWRACREYWQGEARLRALTTGGFQ